MAFTSYSNGKWACCNKCQNGTTINNKGHELVVNGGILCEEIEVFADVPHSDFVFEKDYDLMNLEDVKKFIDENKHLPEIPSAEEFKKGYKLGTMDDLLLRKIEDLTLYLVELNERNKNL